MKLIITPCSTFLLFSAASFSTLVNASVESNHMFADKVVYVPQEQIVVTLKANLPEIAANAWIGIIPADIAHGDEATNDSHDLQYRYVRDQKDHVLFFTAPENDGIYTLRFNDTDTNGKEIDYLTFEVNRQSWIENSQLKTDKRIYHPDEPVVVSFGVPGNFTERGWVGLIPSAVEHGSSSVNDQHDLAYQYTRKEKSGEFTFAAPYKTGKYDFRLNDKEGAAGIEVASVTFTVSVDPWLEQIRFKADKAFYSPGEPVLISYSVPDTVKDSAYFAIVPSDVPHVDERTVDSHDVSYKKIDRKYQSTLQMSAPSKPGTYDVRFQDNDSNGYELGYVSFTVRAIEK
ncbi:hypothetical protein [Alteromonas lipolytica]|uniref:DUF4198 domain-containing protein n=1 Tax=Alteromonas lipolytica TaxID=1856405 RepID=A0A1E8F8L8_9ALTE|nr:hypothetical protein [Alteromonas lipolytica]OFI32255.1 hypothetical protein BFC17_07325 [Alteromonas lipolytica]GGF86058.1 hypothetical protein GCM10011338_42970 [Alteromonas lipolytica]